MVKSFSVHIPLQFSLPCNIFSHKEHGSIADRSGLTKIYTILWTAELG